MGKVYRYLNNSDKFRGEVALHDYRPGNFVVQCRTGQGIRYRIYKNLEDMYDAHMSLHACNRTFNEIILEGHQKFRLDIDTHIRDPSDMDTLIKVIRKVLKGIYGLWDSRVLVYDIVSSHHIVIPGLFMETSGCCHMVATIIQHKIHKKLPYIADAIDTAIYKGVQAFRIEGSTKHMQYRWKYLTGLQDISPLEKFKEGIIGYIMESRLVDTDDIVAYAIKTHIYSPITETIDSGKYSLGIDMKAFTKKSQLGDMTILTRIRPSYCQLCKRTHDHENAYMVGNRIYCRRFGL